MERSSKRGKIPQQDWPAIMARYEAGETLASIARTYDCSPPAISYIVSRSRARSTPMALAPSDPISPESHLAKGQGTETPIRELPQGEGMPDEAGTRSPALGGPHRVEGSAAEAFDVARAPKLHDRDSLAEGDGTADSSQQDKANEGGNGNSSRSFDPATGPSQNIEPRRTLHLSLSHGNEVPGAPDPQSHGGHDANISGEWATSGPAGGQQSFAQSGGQRAGSYPQSGNGASIRMASEPHITKESRAFIDQALRQRVESDITAFLAAFDAALVHDSTENRAGLREATDRLLRAGARTRIELERLEARVPLPSRNDGKRQEPTWRQR